MKHARLPLILALAVIAMLVWSGIGPHDRLTWWAEVLPVLIALPLLAFTYKEFPLTPLAYILIALHAAILMYGGHYTYALTPFGDWMRDAFDFSRNHYDRIGHLAQGFVPAVIARELLLRTSPLKPGKWLFAIVLLSCLGISAFTNCWNGEPQSPMAHPPSVSGHAGRCLGYPKRHGAGRRRRGCRPFDPLGFARQTLAH